MTNSLRPVPAEIKALRSKLGLTQSQCAALVHSSTITWQKYEQGKRNIHPAIWELFLIRTNMVDKSRLSV